MKEENVRISVNEINVENRLRICNSVDAVECHRCGCFAPEPIEANINWFIDSHMDETGTEIAEIYCPQCW